MTTPLQRVLFSVRCDTIGEPTLVDYETIESAMSDRGLQVLAEVSVAVSIWIGALRVTPDLYGWEALRAQLINNAPTILRGIE